jgi:hypothetical protein
LLDLRLTCQLSCWEQIGYVAKFFKIRDNARFLAIEKPMISFKGVHFPKVGIPYAVFFYVRYGVSYRDLEEIMEERGVSVDHATLYRWVIDYSLLIAAEFHVLWAWILNKTRQAGNAPFRCAQCCRSGIAM